MPASLTVPEVLASRMQALLLDGGSRSPLEAATWCGAMQAQDAASGHWSLGARCAGISEVEVVGSFERGELVRTWAMRGTLHIVPAQDVTWMLDVAASRVAGAAARRRAQLGITAQDLQRSGEALSAILRGHRAVGRAEVVEAMAAAGVDVSGQRGYHLLGYAAAEGLVCVGPQRGREQTFVLLDEWAPTQTRLAPDEARAEMLLRYVRSHGPMLLADFTGWSGLTLGSARTAAAANDGRIERVATAVGEMWCTVEAGRALRAGGPAFPSMVALPGFDEFILGYKDRTLQVPAGAMDAIVPGGNGVFRATLVRDGVVIATWKGRRAGERVVVDVTPLARWSAVLGREAVTAFAPYAEFLGVEVEVRIVDAGRVPA